MTDKQEPKRPPMEAYWGLCFPVGWALGVLLAIIVVGFAAYARPEETRGNYGTSVVSSGVAREAKPRHPRSAEHVFVTEKAPEECRLLVIVDCLEGAVFDWRGELFAFASLKDFAEKSSGSTILGLVRKRLTRLESSANRAENGGCLAEVADIEVHSPPSLPRWFKNMSYEQQRLFNSNLRVNGAHRLFRSGASGFGGDTGKDGCQGSTYRCDDGSESLRDVPPVLSVCKCYSIFSSVRRAPLFAVIGVFAILGVTAVGIIGAGLLFLSWYGRPWLGGALLLVGAATWFGTAWSARQMGNCHPLSHCYGKQNAPAAKIHGNANVNTPHSKGG